MEAVTRTSRALIVLMLVLLALAVLALPPLAWSEEPRVGVVATLLGTVTVSRVALPEPTPLRFKDDVFLRDRIRTGENSAVRLLLGGKATVTARERSILTITEVPGTSTVFLTAGRTAVAVSKDKMKPGETVEIRVPNAVVAIRGTVVVAEVSPTRDGYRSTITILRGLVEVTKLDPATGQPVGPVIKVGALERVTVTDAKPLPAPEAISPEAAKRLASDFTVLPKNAPQASVEALNEDVKAASMIAAEQIMNTISASGTSILNSGSPTEATSGAGSGATSTVTATASSSVSTVSTLGGSTVSTPSIGVTNLTNAATRTITNTVTNNLLGGLPKP